MPYHLIFSASDGNSNNHSNNNNNNNNIDNNINNDIKTNNNNSAFPTPVRDYGQCSYFQIAKFQIERLKS